MTTRLLHATRVAFIAAALIFAPAALAKHGDGSRGHWVPEFDPAAGGALIALLAGGALFIANRRNKRK